MYDAIRRLFVPQVPQVTLATAAAEVTAGVLCLGLWVYQRVIGVRSGSLPLLTDLEDDLLLLVDVIYALVKPQADAQGVSDVDFGRALGGEAIAGAHEAFWRELADFFRSLKRPAEARAIEKQLAVVNAAMVAAERRIDALDVDVLVAETAGGSSSSAPASSDATPDR